MRIVKNNLIAQCFVNTLTVWLISVKGALCVYPSLTAVHFQTELQKADRSRLKLSSETLVFLQSGFWQMGLPVSTNKLFWNSETRCPQGYSLSQNLQKNFSSCVSEKGAFSLCAKVMLKEAKNVYTPAEALSLSLPTAAADLHWHLLQCSAPSHAWHGCALAAPPPLLPEHVCPRPTSRPTLTNRIKRGEIGKAKRWQANDSEHTVSEKHRQAGAQHIHRSGSRRCERGRMEGVDIEHAEMHIEMSSLHTHTLTPI